VEPGDSSLESNRQSIAKRGPRPTPRPFLFSPCLILVVSVGGDETRAAGGTFKDANIRLRDVLLEKGYAVKYVEVPGGEHEFIHWRTTIGDGLIFLTSTWGK